MRLRCRLGVHSWTERSQEAHGDCERDEYDDGYVRGWMDYQTFAITWKCNFCDATRIRTERRRVAEFADEYRRDSR